MSQPSAPEPEQEINITNTNNEGQIVVAGHDANVIEGNNNIQGDNNIITYFQTEIIQLISQEIKARKLCAESPYKGLRKFESEDRAKFFGREQFLTGLINDLEQSDWILLLGASGSGKSSVVRAGLIPWLEKKHSKKFVKLTFTPDEDPFESLHASLLGQYKQSEVKFALQSTAETLTQVVTTLKQSEDYWLIFIDQFEELFTLSSEHQRNLFIDSLVRLMQAQNSEVKLKVKLIFTMRADFLDRIGAYPALGKLTQKHIRLMTDMQRDELWLAIEQPAIHHGVVFEDGLVEEIVKDVQGQAGCLPLLQYTLDLFWATEFDKGAFADRTLSINTYRQLGGARGALQQRVNLIYNALSETEKLAVQRIMLKLVDISGDEASGTEWKPVRRRAQRSEFSDRLEQQLLMELINRNLLISNLHPQSQVATVEIAHEVLLTSWASLHDWIQSNRQVIALRNRLNEDVLRWQTKKVEDELWSGSKLEQVLELRKNSTFNQVLGGFSEQANRFIDDSLGIRDRQRRRTIIGLASFTSVLAIVAGFALWQWQQATLQTIKSLTQSSVALLASHKEIDSLVEALTAGNTKPLLGSDADTQHQVQLALQHTLYKMSERNRLEHDNSVRSVSFSPNGQFIATASEDSTVRLWNNAGKEIYKFPVQNQLFRTVTFNSDSTMIAAISADNTIKVWGIDGQEIATEKGQDKEDNFMSGICFVPKTNIIAASGSGNTVNLLRIDGQKLHSIKTITGHNSSVWSISCSEDGKIVTTDKGGFLGLWNKDGTELKKPFRVSEQSIYGVSFSPDGKTVAIAGGDTIVRLWNLDSLEIKTIGKHNNQVTSVSFSRNGRTIASTSMDNTLKLWSREGKELKTLEGHGDRVYSASFSLDGNTLASASDDNTVKIWSIDDRESKTFPGHRDSLYGVSFSPKGETIASAGDGVPDNNTIKLWSSDGRELQSFKAKSSSGWNRIWSLSFSANGQKIATANNDRTIVLWNLNGEKITTFKGHDAEVIDVKFNPKDPLGPEDPFLASASYDGTVKLWGMDGNCIKTFNGNAGKVRSVSFSHDGKIIASAQNNGTIKLWNSAGQEDQKPRTLKGHSAYVTDVSFSYDGRIIASAGKDKIIRLWNLEGQELKSLKGHTGAVTRISFKHDDTMIASASTDGTIRLWDLTNNGQEIKTLKRKGVSYPFWNVSFSPDGKKVVSVSDDFLVELWNAETQDSQQLISQGCKWLDNYLKNRDRSKHSVYEKICKGIQ